MVYNCKCSSWVTEKECKLCFEQEKKHRYNHIKHCRKDNVIEIEDNKIKDYE